MSTLQPTLQLAMTLRKTDLPSILDELLRILLFLELSHGEESDGRATNKIERNRLNKVVFLHFAATGITIW